MLLVNFFKPGAVLISATCDMTGAKDLVGKTQEFTLQKFVEHVFPKSVFEAMANNEILQLVDLQYFLWRGNCRIGEYAKIVVKGTGCCIACDF